MPDEALRKKLLTLQGLFAHQGNLSLIELLHKICDCQIEIENASRTQSPPRAQTDSMAEVSRQVWKRGECKCENCGSLFALQEDHRTPKAVGGSYNLENLRLLCRSCNQRAAIEFYGPGKMDKFANMVGDD